MKYHALFVSFGKGAKLKLSSAANYRWRFKGLIWLSYDVKSSGVIMPRIKI